MATNQSIKWKSDEVIEVYVSCFCGKETTESNKLNLAYLAVYGSAQAVGSRRLKQLPRPSFVERDDRSHVVLAHRAVDERGDVDAPQPLHTVQVCKWLIGKIPAQQTRTWWQGQRGTSEVIL